MSRTWQWCDNENCWIRCCQTIAITRCSADDITIHANIAPWSSAKQFSATHRIFTSLAQLTPSRIAKLLFGSPPSLTQTCDLRHCFVFTRWSDTLAVYIQISLETSACYSAESFVRSVGFHRFGLWLSFTQQSFNCRLFLYYLAIHQLVCFGWLIEVIERNSVTINYEGYCIFSNFSHITVTGWSSTKPRTAT